MRRLLTIILGIFLVLPCSFSAAVEWTTLAGGNQHFYELVTNSGLTWVQAKADAESRWVLVNGVTKLWGHLVTLTSASENAFITSAFSLSATPWIGAYQTSKLAEPAGNWAWVTGEAWSYINWSTGEPNDSNGDEDAAHIYTSGAWNDLHNPSTITAYIVEYDLAAPIPEPGTWILVSLCSMAFIWWRKR